MIQNGFTQSFPHDYFSLSLSDTSKFVDIVNQVITEQVNDKYVLIKEEGISESISLRSGTSQKELYFNVAYFSEKDLLQDNISSIPIEAPQIAEDIITNLNGMIDKIEMIKLITDIDLIASKLKSLLEFTTAKKQIIQIKQQYNQ